MRSAFNLPPMLPKLPKLPNDCTVYNVKNNWMYNLVFSYISGISYNPFSFNKNVSFSTDFTLQPNSLYVNFKLSDNDRQLIQENLPPNLEIIPMKLITAQPQEEYLLSVNIYNVTSVLFNGKVAPRLEANVYVKDTAKQNRTGTLIIEYVSAIHSFDPVNLYRDPHSHLVYTSENGTFSVSAKTNPKSEKKAHLHFSGTIQNEYDMQTSTLAPELIRATDRVYYQCGIFEKLFYRSSFVYSAVNILPTNEPVVFGFKIPGTNDTLNFSEVYSTFVFPEKIDFVALTWYNRK
jgi:hypothetical protein